MRGLRIPIGSLFAPVKKNPGFRKKKLPKIRKAGRKEGHHKRRESEKPSGAFVCKNKLIKGGGARAIKMLGWGKKERVS